YASAQVGSDELRGPTVACTRGASLAMVATSREANCASTVERLRVGARFDSSAMRSWFTQPLNATVVTRGSSVPKLAGFLAERQAKLGPAFRVALVYRRSVDSCAAA